MPGTYRIDAAGTTVAFTVKALFGTSTVRGTFTVAAGTVVVADDPARSAVSVTLDATSFHTSNARRDRDVRSPRFLGTSRYPLMSFVSFVDTGVAPAADGGWTLTGDLTVRDTTTPVTFTVCAPERTADGFACRATARIDRRACGVTVGPGMVGRWLSVDLTVHAAATA